MRRCIGLPICKILIVPATPEEMKLLVDAFENAYPPLARALADLLVRGVDILDEHRLGKAPLSGDFEALIFKLSQDCGISEQVLSSAVSALRRLRVTVEQLDRLP